MGLFNTPLPPGLLSLLAAPNQPVQQQAPVQGGFAGGAQGFQMMQALLPLLLAQQQNQRNFQLQQEELSLQRDDLASL
jgi:hypothetical protein